MPKYSNTQTAGDIVVSAQLDTTANTITYTVTGPNGLTTAATQQAPVTSTIRGPAQASIATTRALLAPFQEAGVPGLAAAGRALTDVTQNVTSDANRAEEAATATNTPVPENPAPPPSTNNATDPAVPPAPNNTPLIESPFPPAAVTLSSVSVQESLSEGEEVIQNSTSTTVVSVQESLSEGEEVIQPKKQPDDATGVDAQVAANQAQNDAVTSANAPTRFGLSAALTNTQSQATRQDTSNFKQLGDWRVRLSLAPGATYLYKDPNVRTNQSILLPLAQTDGVIFPYTPAISVSYVADYAPTNLTHSNYTFNSYTNSKVENITIGCDFTAQDTAEANYLLAVIHFFRSVTKMFYGQDSNPKNGTPPPLCYLNGLGTFQFDEHPLAITAFNYTLPTDVDYIRAGNPTTDSGVNKSPQTSKSNAPSTSGDRLNNNNLSPGGRPGAPVFSINYSTIEPTYVPTKISLSITAVPIVTRKDISNTFSLAKYATGELLRGSKRAGGGIW